MYERLISLAGTEFKGSGLLFMFDKTLDGFVTHEEVIYGVSSVNDIGGDFFSSGPCTLRITPLPDSENGSVPYEDIVLSDYGWKRFSFSSVWSPALRVQIINGVLMSDVKLFLRGRQ